MNSAPNRQMIFALLSLAVIAPVLWRASMKETNPYFKYGLRITAGVMVFANLDQAGKAMQQIARTATPRIPVLNVGLQQRESPRVVEGDLVDT